MHGDIALAGFVLTADEWRALDAQSRAQLLAAAFQHDAPWLAMRTINLGVSTSGNGQSRSVSRGTSEG